MTAAAPPPLACPAIMVYVTCGSPAEATAIGRSLVGERLAACANIIPAMTSIYHWEGAVSEDNETILLLKTTPARLDAVTERVKALHSYDLPCVVALPLVAGNADYVDWIAAETADA